VTADDLATSIERLLNQVGHWEQSRWSAPASSAPASSVAGPSGVRASVVSRAEVVHALVQCLADRTADAECRARRPVPRPGDLVLPDQLRVVSGDLLAAGAPDHVLTLATEDVDTVRHAI
jgi:hypothetical protein